MKRAAKKVLFRTDALQVREGCPPPASMRGVIPDIEFTFNL
jgi:hypothetical protein